MTRSSERFDVVCIADMEWDHALWTNRQHVMSRLPAVDPRVRVLYVSPPRLLAPALTRGRLSGRGRHGLYAAGERLWVLQPSLPVPARLLRRPFPVRFMSLTTRLALRALRKLEMRDPIVWSYTPLLESFLGRLGERLLCYDVVDDYPAQPGYVELGERVERYDRELTRRADLVLFASRERLEQRAGLNPHSHFVGNAADTHLFSRAREGRVPEPDDLAGIPHPRVVFHGALTESKIDVPLVAELADRLPRLSFVFIGPVKDAATARLATLPNVHLLGLRPQPSLVSYLAHADMSFIPYKRSRYTTSVSALKVYESLAAGLPVIASDLPGFRELAPHVKLARSVDEFEAALGSPAAPDRAATEAVVRKYSWEAKAGRCWELVEQRVMELGIA